MLERLIGAAALGRPSVRVGDLLGELDMVAEASRWATGELAEPDDAEGRTSASASASEEKDGDGDIEMPDAPPWIGCDDPACCILILPESSC
ncbi:uncharacterized protein APUU_31227A [Aspergillus puulaauensis]|uniref:Uncharacterized protein n=1 Tax=Aspergillus puulaauensis TaxID=1220207 RepID=A0A7R7XK71_9EURO|nr:uncharacterized protein APUU_31227A [Aspergillus puulaauensis]BCS23002.1 hypothetical protein APUU_31227A [Aspergillus puulaauensis]